MTITKRIIWDEHFLGIVIVLAFLLPHTSSVLLLLNPLLCFLLVLRSSGRQRTSIVLVPLIPILMATLFNIGGAQMKALQSVATILLYFACFPFVGNLRVRNIYLYICLGIILLSQVVYLLDLPYIGQMIDRLYPIPEDNIAAEEYERNNITYTTVFNYRLGGLYHNSNQCSKYLTILLAFFLVNNRDERINRLILFSLLAYLGILITGSRTGFVVSTLVVFFAFFRKRRLPGYFKLLLGTIAIIGFYFFIQNAMGTLRGLDIESGISNSAASKWETFLYWLNNEHSFFSLLFGHLDTSLFEGKYGVAMNSFDSEYGILAFRFGLIGLFAVGVFWLLIFRRMESYSRIFLIILLWMVSSTIICSYRTSFVFMLLLSVLYSRGRIKV